MKENLYCIIGSKFTTIGGVDFACLWSCIGKGLRLQPAQQACFNLMPNIIRELSC